MSGEQSHVPLDVHAQLMACEQKKLPFGKYFTAKYGLHVQF